jgi:ABC-type multidrug transport system permease subunit
MIRGINAIMYKESRHILRDPRTLFLILVIPCLEMVIFGFAINLDVKNIPTVVYNLDGRESSRMLLDRFRNSGYFKILGNVQSDEELNHTIVLGRAKVGIKIPPNFSDTMLTGQKTQVQVMLDGSDSTTALQALNVSNAIGMLTSLQMLSKVTGNAELPVETRPRVLFNPDMRTATFMIPALVGVIMQVVITLLTAFAIVREKEQGTLEQLMVTPVSRLGLILGKLFPYGVIGIGEMASVLFLMRFLFQVPVAGSLFYLCLFSVFFTFTALSLGLLISTIAHNHVEALQCAFLILVPSFLLSGFMFPQDTMPPIIYWFGQLIPVTYFIHILRAIILRAAPFDVLWPSGLVLLAMGVIIITLATLRFHKTLA